MKAPEIQQVTESSLCFRAFRSNMSVIRGIYWCFTRVNPVNVYCICIIRRCSRYTQCIFVFIHRMWQWVITVSGWGWGVAPPKASTSPHKPQHQHKETLKKGHYFSEFNVHVFSLRQIVLFVPPSSSTSFPPQHLSLILMSCLLQPRAVHF